VPRRLARLVHILLAALATSSGPSYAQQPEAAPPQWIWLNDGGRPAAKVYFRKVVDSGGVAAARLFAAADDGATVYVDGEPVLRNVGSAKPAYVDVSKPLDLDSPVKLHVLAIEAENTADRAGLFVRLDLDSGWRDAWTLGSDRTWKASTTAPKGWMEIGFDDSQWKSADVVAELADGPWARTINSETLAAVAPLKEPTATPAESLKLKPGFHAELVYSVPKDRQGSWVNMCTDPKGRLIVSDQYGGLYRITPQGINGATEPAIEPIHVDIGEAQGLLWAFDSLYVSVNRGDTYPGGLYRVRDTDGDDQLDALETLRPLEGSGEHGPHAVLPHPDGKSLVIVCGNRTTLTEIDTSRVPRSWDEDRLLPRPQGKFMRGVRAPGGWIARIDPDGKQWELMATGFRNQYDAAYNEEGELFTFDADMEWDLNTPWYRPTRICHVISGAEFGWRSGGGKWPVTFEDSVPPVVNVGPGSPTGVTFGYGAKFPPKYQQALYAADWSHGKLYAVHLVPEGGTYTATLEEFITGTPLPLTDVIVNPVDGAMYFLIGGRKVQSGLYRVTYTGDEPTTRFDFRPRPPESALAYEAGLKRLHERRREIEEHHLGGDETTVEDVWDDLAGPRFVRYAARVALEHRPRAEWMERALAEKNPQASLIALMALARTFERQDKGTEPDIDSLPPVWSEVSADADPERAQVRRRILESLDRLSWADLDVDRRHDLLRVLTLTFLRVAPPNEEERAELIARGKVLLPTGNPDVDSGLAELLVYAQAPYAAEVLVPLLEEAPTQEQQIDLAAKLRHLRVGWTPELRKRYFEWFTRAGGYRGGASFDLFVENIKADAVAQLDAATKRELEPILTAKPRGEMPAFTATPRPFVRKWTMEELVPLIETGLHGRDFDRGRRMFAATACFGCHRFDNQGGAVGPDLTALAGRFSPRDILESIVDPSKQISDQYAAVQIVTIDGKVIVGRIVNLAGDSVRVQQNMLDPGNLTGVDRRQIEEMFPAKTSMMPTGLLDTLHEEELLDLFAYLLSRGDRSHAMFERE
jgi:putative heme-binding domain-containing protein